MSKVHIRGMERVSAAVREQLPEDLSPSVRSDSHRRPSPILMGDLADLDPLTSLSTPRLWEMDGSDVDVKLSGVFSGLCKVLLDLQWQALKRDPSFPSYVSPEREEVFRVTLELSLWYGLVGIESNPGPTHKKGGGKQAAKQTITIRTAAPKGERGGSIGNRVGSKIGGFVGDMAQKAIMAITGMGDYTVKQNSLYSGAIMASGPPAFRSSGAGSTRITHREYLGDVRSTGGNFNAGIFNITPTNAVTFPWLSTIAINFDQYRIHGMVFEFRTNSATAVASTNTALGAVIMATQYNFSEPGFNSKLQMEQYQYSVSTVPSCSAIHPVECKRDMGFSDMLYTTSQGAQSDPRLSNFGKFTVATVGQQAASNLGELWVSYDIELFKPRMFVEGNNPVSALTFFGATAAGVNKAGNYRPADLFWPGQFVPFNTSGQDGWTVNPTSTFNVTFGSVANGLTPNTLYFPIDAVGKFLLVLTLDFSTDGTGTWAWGGQAVTPVGNGILGSSRFQTNGNTNSPYFPAWGPASWYNGKGTSASGQNFVLLYEFFLTGQNGGVQPQLNFAAFPSVTGGTAANLYDRNLFIYPDGMDL